MSYQTIPQNAPTTSLPGKVWNPLTRSYDAGGGYPTGPAGGAAENSGTIGTAANQQAAGASQTTGADYTVDSAGNATYKNQTPQQMSLDQSRAKLQADAEARRLAALSSSFSAGSQDMLPRVGGSNIASNENDARAAAFGRAKDQAGQIARSAMTAVEENVAGRGVAGGGIEALQKAGALQDASAPLQDLTREQYIQDLNRSSDISDQTYQGDITQRGQDITQKNAQRASLLALINNAFAPALY